MARDHDQRDDINEVIQQATKDVDPKPNPATLKPLETRLKKLNAEVLFAHSDFLRRLATAEPNGWADLVQEFLLQRFDLVAQSHWDINVYHDGDSSYRKILDDNVATDIVPRIEAFSTILEDPKFSFRVRALVEAHKNYYLGHAAKARLGIEKSTKATSWTQIEIKFISDERVQIRSGDHPETLNYSEMGFEDHRSGKPKEAWTLLRIFAQERGVVRDGSTFGKNWTKIEKGVQEIRKVLRVRFGIDGDPLPFQPGIGYTAVFSISISPSYDS